ncbi:MAG: dTMP kinase [Akkermansiaceae bacterium]|nr:dTMP kinase [Akkermansiaceae bacterium]
MPSNPDPLPSPIVSHVLPESSRVRQVVIGTGIIVVCGALIIALALLRQLPGFAGEFFGKIAGMLSTPLIMEGAIGLLGFLALLTFNHIRRLREGDDFVTLDVPETDFPLGDGAAASGGSGMFIVLEGIDGTGKSTHVARLAEWFRNQGREAVTSFEPTRGPWGNKLRESASSGRLSPDEELELFLKDRREHVEQLIRPSLEAGKVVILDRYYFSTMAYQGARGIDIHDIRARNEAFAPKPDHLFILDLDVDTALARIGARGDTANEFEKREALQKCREIFLSLTAEPFAHLVDASQSLDAVQEQIRSCLGAIKAE